MTGKSPVRGGAVAVAAGILASRVLGLVRQKAFAFFLGDGPAADAFNVAFRIPNVLQNLFGEGVLSASFIPVYARLRGGDDAERRREVAGAVFGALALGVAVATLVGVLAAPVLVRLLAPGFEGEQRAITVHLVRILFPGAALLVLSAWCLGILNSHGRFLLSYASPVAWNLSMIVALVGWGRSESAEDLVVFVAIGSVIGSALQLGVQWPTVSGLLGAWRPRLRSSAPETATVFRNFWPALVGRGVTQLAGFIDVMVASLLVGGSATMLANAQVVYMLPVSLFGMSVSAAALPDLSTEAGGGPESAAPRVRALLDGRLSQVAFLVIPSAVALVALGPAIIGLLFEGGAFSTPQVAWQRWTLAAAGVGLVGATQGRLYSTTLFALQDTRTPQRIAIVRVLFAAVTGIAGALWAVPYFRLEPRFGVVALLLASGLAAWLEWGLLRGAVARRLGRGSPTPAGFARMWGAAALAAGVALVVAGLGSPNGLARFALHLATLGAYGLAYFGAARLLGVPEAAALVRRVRQA